MTITWRYHQLNKAALAVWSRTSARQGLHILIHTSMWWIQHFFPKPLHRLLWVHFFKSIDWLVDNKPNSLEDQHEACNIDHIQLYFFIISCHPGVTRTTRWGPVHTTTLPQFKQRHSVTIISLTECYIKTLVTFVNIVIYFILIKPQSSVLLTYLLTYLPRTVLAVGRQSKFTVTPSSCVLWVCDCELTSRQHWTWRL